VKSTSRTLLSPAGQHNATLQLFLTVLMGCTIRDMRWRWCHTHTHTHREYQNAERDKKKEGRKFC